MTGPTLVVRRWRQHGHDRLYVRTAQGVEVGYLDLLTSKTVLRDQMLRTGFRAAIDTWLQSKGAIITAQPMLDLATNTAGAAIREKQAELDARNPLVRYTEGLLGKDEARSWRTGAEGEERVATILEALPRQWTVIHAVPVGHRGSDIDHVAIGPTGVFTINTKRHPGKAVRVKENDVTVGGSRAPYARNARFEASRATALLSQACGFEVTVRGIVAFDGHRHLEDLGQPRDGKVTLLPAEQVPGWMLHQPLALPPRWAEAVVKQARDPRTWLTHGSVSE